MTKHEIIGYVNVQREDVDKKRCGCCNGKPHAYSASVKLDYAIYPEHFAKSADNWLWSVFDLKEMHGKKIRITAEVIE